MSFPRLVVVASAMVFGALGVGFVLFPQTLGHVVGIELTSVTAHNDFRAVYGGVPAGLAVFLVMALRRSDWQLAALWVIALTLGGLAATRFLSWGLDGWPSPVALVLHGAEISGVVLTAVAIRQGSAPSMRDPGSAPR